jgi:flagellar basal-body rod protein FlgF/flagellar basal-body rod protein FlgG
MSSGYYAACTGLVSRTQALDTIANNIANTSTAGFRATHNIFSSVLASTGASPLSVLNQDANDYGVLSGTRVDTAQGSLVRTDNTLDFALEGPGYFAVQTGSETVYTRGGNFKISPKGQLTTANGDLVLGDNGPISIVGMPVSISADGTITANGAIAGRLKTVEFAPGQEMQSAGGSYYTAIGPAPVAATNTEIRQGMLEGSNVNPVTSVIEMIEAQREVESMRRMLTMFSTEMDKTAAQDLPRVS